MNSGPELSSVSSVYCYVFDTVYGFCGDSTGVEASEGFRI